jgi:hypothetical protein
MSQLHYRPKMHTPVACLRLAEISRVKGGHSKECICGNFRSRAPGRALCFFGHDREAPGLRIRAKSFMVHGLTLSRKLARTLEGDVTLKRRKRSVPGQGSVFSARVRDRNDLHGHSWSITSLRENHSQRGDGFE